MQDAARVRLCHSLLLLVNYARAEQDVRSKEFSSTRCLCLLLGEMQYNKILINLQSPVFTGILDISICQTSK